MTLPNLFLMAAPRSGSTQLAHWLDSHPDITLSPIKEPNFFAAHEFDPAEVAQNHLNDIDPTRSAAAGHPRPAQFAIFRKECDYRSLFAPMTTPWRMEASTTYLTCPEAPAAIARAVPDARVIVLTRDPVARAISHYRLAVRTGRTRASLGQELAAEIAGHVPLSARYLIRPSRHGAGVARVQACFAAQQCLTLDFDRLIADPAATLSKIADWLVLPDAFDLTRSAQNASAAPRFPALNAALHRSGLKTALRRTLPVSLKQTLKPLWFDASARADIAPADLRALQDAVS